MKRVLLLTFYWPPCGGHAVLRWVKFVKNFPERYRITVVTADSSAYSAFDYGLGDDLVGIDTIRIPLRSLLIFNRFFCLKNLPYGSLSLKEKTGFLKKLVVFIRLNFIIPDLRYIWNFSAWRYLKKLLKSEKYDLLITTGPPHSTHLLGLKAKRMSGMKWLADFRDPWSEVVYLEDAHFLAKKVHYLLEKKVCDKADRILTVSNFIANRLPAENKRISVIYNSFETKLLGFEKKWSEHFRVKYIGSLTQGQDMKKVLECLSEYCLKNSVRDVEFSFVGTDINNECFTQFKGLKIRKTPFLDYKTAMKETLDSEVLILLINQYKNNEGMITTKLFDYIGSRNLILGFGPEEGEAARLIEDFGAGTICEYDKQGDFLDYFSRVYLDWKKGKYFRNEADLTTLTSEYRTEQLIEIMESPNVL